MKLYKDKDWLCKKYIIDGLFMTQIARICNVHNTTILNWINKFNIKRKSRSEIKKRCYKLHPESFKGNCKPKTKEHRQKISESLKGRKLPEEVKKKLKGIQAGENNPFYGKKHSPEVMKKILKSRSIKPNKPERLFNELTPKNVRYVGNFSFWKTMPNGKHKNPDFKVTGQNKVIEIFGGRGFFHTEKEAKKLIKSYKDIRINCLIIWDTEIYKQSDKVLEKVNNFIGEI